MGWTEGFQVSMRIFLTEFAGGGGEDGGSFLECGGWNWTDGVGDVCYFVRLG